MSVTYARLTAQRTWSLAQKGERKGQRVYKILCSDKVNDDADVASAALPAIDTAWSVAQPDVTVQSRSVDEGQEVAGGGIFYIGTVEYESTSIEGEQKDPDPTEREGILRLNYENTEETIYTAKDDKPTAEDSDGAAVTINTYWFSKMFKCLCNSAGNPFPDGLKEDKADAVYTFEKNVTTETWASLADTLDAFINTINEEPFKIIYRGVERVFQARTVKLTQATSEPGFENDVKYEKLNLTLKERKDGWLRKTLDQGFQQYRDNDPTPSKPKEPIRDANGNPVIHPVLLDGAGKPLTSTGKPVFLKFRTKDLKDFGLLPFDEFEPA